MTSVCAWCAWCAGPWGSLACQTLLPKKGERVWLKLYYAVVLCGRISTHYVLTNSHVLWSTVCIPNHTTHTTWAPAAELYSLRSLYGLVVWVYSESLVHETRPWGGGGVPRRRCAGAPAGTQLAWRMGWRGHMPANAVQVVQS